MEELNVQYVTDESGNKTAVQITYQDWIEIKKRLAEYLAIERLKDGLASAFKEVRELKKDKENQISLNDFL